MDIVYGKYKRILSELKKIDNEISILEKNDMVKRYLKLKDKEEQLDKKRESAYEEYVLNTYSNCKHVIMMSHYECDYMEGRSYRYYGCIKCGLDSKIYSDNLHYDLDLDIGNACLMDKFFKSQNCYGGNNYMLRFEKIDLNCDISLARDKYNELKDAKIKVDELDTSKLCELLEYKISEKEKTKKLILL